MKRDFETWFPDDGETEDEACDVMGVHDAQEAAEQACEAFRVGPDYDDEINGDPVRVMVQDETTGERWCFDVSCRTSIDYSAEQVDLPVGGAS